MIRQLYIPFILCLAWAASDSVTLNAQEQSDPGTRRPAVAGTFYPAGKQELELSLKELFSNAKPAQLEGRVQSLIVPHAGYPFSGKVAASGYKSISKDTEYKNIFIIASSHKEQFRGASVYASGNYATPLGEARVNLEIANALIEGNEEISFYKQAHDREHSIEVQVPFIQYHFKDTPPIIPIVMGSSSISAARDLAAALLPYYIPENLFIISSDFSHYPDYENAKRIDGLTGDAIVKKDPEHFYNMLGKNSREPVQNLSTPCCGWSSIMTMLYMSERRENLKISPILYQNSGDTPIGDKERVVGYWAIAGHELPHEPLTFVLDENDKKALLEISRKTLETYLRSGNVPSIPASEIPKIAKEPAGAFISLYMGGRLRGCIGNFSPETPLYLVVQEMTLAAASRDHRFVPVEVTELEYIDIEISVLTPLQKISSIEEFQLGKHGIYMVKDGRSGTYLPQVGSGSEWSKEEFLGHCAREKAGIGWDGWKEADLYVYEAIVFGEEKRK
jgi:AmmeMemoRadiSam system protein B/AmmeMemoRadiSam system protein A